MTGGFQARFERRQRAWRWTWLLDSPLCIATWVTITLGAWSLQRVGESLGRAAALQREVDAELARLAADTVLMTHSEAVCARGGGVVNASVGEIAVEARRVGDEFVVACTLPDGRVHEFVADLLPGAGPVELGEPRSDVVPELDPNEMLRAARADELRAFRRDGAIALMHLESGTGLGDFVLESGCISRFKTELVEVSGHLWVEPDPEPLVVSLARDTTVVVRGNLYLGRTLRVRGPGRLVFVVTGSDTATPFADRDGNGRRSAGERGPGGEVASAPAAPPGPIEGGGNVYFGVTATDEPLECDASVLAVGYAHCRSPEITIAGGLATAAAADPVWLRPPGRLATTGARRFRPTRERVPGFGPIGAPRPGVLRPREASDS